MPTRKTTTKKTNTHAKPATRQAAGKKKKKAAKKATPSATAASATTRRLKKTLRQAEGCAAWVEVGEQVAGKIDASESHITVSIAAPTSCGKPETKRKGGYQSLHPQVFEAFAAASHPVRSKLLQIMLRRPATYKELQTATKLQAGPLYHHINQLRSGNLLRPKERDTYELTRAGRNLILIMLSSAPLLRDKRRRPTGKS